MNQNATHTDANQPYPVATLPMPAAPGWKTPPPPDDVDTARDTAVALAREVLHRTVAPAIGDQADREETRAVFGDLVDVLGRLDRDTATFALIQLWGIARKSAHDDLARGKA